jgi:hypothetical protein
VTGRGPLEIVLYGDKAADRVALVDPADELLVAEYRWFVWEFPERNWGPYPVAHIGHGRGAPTKLMHQLLTGFRLCDHHNHNGLDCRRRNLRVVTRRQNLWNQQPIRGGTSQYKGVSSKRSRWRARITIGGRQVSLGSYMEEIDAAIAYDIAASEAFGEYACLNFAGCEQ